MDDTVKRDLWLIMAIMVLFICLVGGVGYVTLSKEVEAIRKTIKEDVAFIDLAKQLKIEILQLRRFEKDYFLNIGAPDKQAEYLQKFDDLAAALPANLANLSHMAQADAHLAAETKRQAAELAANLKDYLEGFQKVIQQVQAETAMTPQKANALMVAFKGSVPVMEKNIAEIDKAGRKMLEEVTAAAVKRGSRAKVFILLMTLTAVVLAGVFGSFLSRTVYQAIFREGFRRLTGRI